MKTTSAGGTSDAFGDIDDASSLAQVSKVYKPSSQKDALAYKDIDEGHGGINQTVQVEQINDVVDRTSFVAGADPVMKDYLRRKRVAVVTSVEPVEEA